MGDQNTGESSNDIARAAAPTLKRSRAYQSRILVSAISILVTIGLIALCEPIGDVVNHGLHDLLRDIGWILLIGGIAIRLWAASCLGGRKSQELVSVGPYSLCRNPLYVGTLLIALSQPFFYESLWVLCGFAIPLVMYAWGVVPAEEKKLEAKFGEAYRQYRRQTPRWVPRFRGYVAEENSQAIRSVSFALEGFRSAAWILLPILSAGITSLRAALH